jgi:hypothetical protein
MITFKQFLLNELALKVNSSVKLTHSAAELARAGDWLLQGSCLAPIEANKYELWLHDDFIGLFNTEKTCLGFVYLETINPKIYEVKKIYIAEDVRGMGLAKMMLFWLKNILQVNLVFGGDIFDSGAKLIRSLSTDTRFKLQLRDPATGKLSPFDDAGLYATPTMQCMLECIDKFTSPHKSQLPGQNAMMLMLGYFNEC